MAAEHDEQLDHVSACEQAAAVLVERVRAWQAEMADAVDVGVAVPEHLERCATEALDHAVDALRRYTAIVASGSDRAEVLAWFREQPMLEGLDDEAFAEYVADFEDSQGHPITADDHLAFVIDELVLDELAWCADRLRRHVERELLPDAERDELERREAIEHAITEEARQTFAQWEQEHPELHPPPFWQRRRPSYRSAYQAWYADRRKRDGQWDETRRRVAERRLRVAHRASASTRARPRERSRTVRRAHAPPASDPTRPRTSEDGDDPPLTPGAAA